MYTTSISKTDKGYVFQAIDTRTMKVVYTSKEKHSHDRAKEESINFLYARPAARDQESRSTRPKDFIYYCGVSTTGGGSGDGSGNGPKRKPFKNVVKDDSEV